MDDLEGAIPVYLKKGDAVVFVDGLMHGGSSRTTEGGERRVTIYRYGPKWAQTRFGYEYSQPLLDRLTPAQRRILQPIPPNRPPAQIGKGTGAKKGVKRAGLGNNDPVPDDRDTRENS